MNNQSDQFAQNTTATQQKFEPNPQQVGNFDQN